MVKRQVRQGDVLLQPVEVLPEGATQVPVKGRITLAEGEVTGHLHTVPARGVKEFALADGRRFLKVSKSVSVEHQEHATLVLKPGIYEVRRQVETWMDEVRQVAD